jgi:hypothetical protein
VALVSQLPFAERVVAEPGYEGVQIWTVIDAEPFADEPSDQVYGAELEAAAATPDAYVSFRLINRREYGDERVTQVLPDDGQIAWHRETQP